MHVNKFEGKPPIHYEKIVDEQDINDCRNNMAKGNYPLGISDCYVVGINGDCGPECPVFKHGDCEEPPEEWGKPWENNA
jgi:hypothetical protein